MIQKPEKDLGVNAHLLGVVGGRAQLNTPALLIDLDIFERNIAKMARHCREQGISLRPHAKTHKSINIARRQLEAGAIGICCAKLGEAEVLARGGVYPILITSPVVSAEGCRRISSLNASSPDLMVVTDSPENVALLARAGQDSGRRLKVVLDLEVGLQRTGMVPGRRAVELARLIEDTPFVELAGIQGYAGHLMHIVDRKERQAKTGAAMQSLAEMRDAIQAEGIACPIVTGGGTGTFDLDPHAGVLTDLQAGSYLFMDDQYVDVWEQAGQKPPFETSLFVQTTVISANLPRLAATDAGLKAFATDAGAPRIVAGTPEGTVYTFLGDEQGGLLFSGSDGLAPGTIITCSVPHCDPTVNLYDHYHIVRGDALVDIWPIDARGRSQ